MILILLSIIFILISLHIYFMYSENARLMKKIPGPKIKFLVGNAFVIILSPAKLFALGRKLASENKDIYRFIAFNIGSVNIYNPEDIETIISTTKFNEKSIIYLFLRPWLREGLLLSKGTKWHQRRKILTHAFHFNILRQFFEILEENSRKLVEKIEHIENNTVDVLPLISEFTLHSICETAMGTKLSEETTGAGRCYKQAIYALGKVLVDRFSRIHLHSDFIWNCTDRRRQQEEHLRVINKFTSTVIEERKEMLEKNPVAVVQANDETSFLGKNKIAMLDLLLLAHKEGSIDTEGIKEEVDTFMFEGHDTTASGLTYCFMSIANYKHIQDKIVTEMQEIFSDTDRQASMEDLTLMKYTERVIKESLRLYPPVPFISRNVTEEVTLSNYKVPAGIECHIHIFDLHRREDIFKDALTFDPNRFLPENSIGRHPYAYIPFSAGPRNCIGQKFAMMEMKLALSSVLRRYEIIAVTKPEDIVFESDLVLRSNSVYVKFKKRV